MSEPHAAAVLQRAAPPKTRRSEVYRHELKYRISYAEKAALELRLAPLLRRDAHAKPGGYRIRSLYFDDWWNSAYGEKEAGVFLRKKYRIRIYDGSDAVIKLERKKKVGSYIYKEDAALTREETERILRGNYGVLLASPQNLCREFYVECVSHVLRPASSWITSGRRGCWTRGPCASPLTRTSGPLWAAGICLTQSSPPCRCWTPARWCWK